MLPQAKAFGTKCLYAIISISLYDVVYLEVWNESHDRIA
jgi:hypothetical protein